MSTYFRNRPAIFSGVVGNSAWCCGNGQAIFVLLLVMDTVLRLNVVDQMVLLVTAKYIYIYIYIFLSHTTKHIFIISTVTMYVRENTNEEQSHRSRRKSHH